MAFGHLLIVFSVLRRFKIAENSPYLAKSRTVTLDLVKLVDLAIFGEMGVHQFRPKGRNWDSEPKSKILAQKSKIWPLRSQNLPATL